VTSGVILIAFGGITDKLIPLFAVGAFGAFTLSQAGMVAHWSRKRGPGARVSLLINALGASATAAALVVIIVAKFVEGAWITLIIVPGLTVLFLRIHRHYRRVMREIKAPADLEVVRNMPPIVIVPIEAWDRVTERALRAALLKIRLFLQGDERIIVINTPWYLHEESTRRNAEKLIA